jgi:hypothetical protein
MEKLIRQNFAMGMSEGNELRIRPFPPASRGQAGSCSTKSITATSLHKRSNALRHDTGAQR